MDPRVRKAFLGLAQSFMALVEIVVGEDNPAMLNGHAPKLLALPSPMPAGELKPPKKKAAKKATKKVGRPRKPAEVLEYDDEDEDEDEPQQKMTRAVSIGEIRESIGSFIVKKGLRDTFTGDDIRALFDFELESQTMTQAMNYWIDQGVIERVEKGNPGKPSKFRKIRVMEGED